MKKLSKLGISPAPWKVATYVEKTTGLKYEDINSSNGAYVADGTTNEDRHLIAAAPELYEALREAVVEYCYYCSDEAGYPCPKEPGACFVQKWRATLAMAAGEEARHD